MPTHPTTTKFTLSERRVLQARASECSLRGKRGRYVFQYARIVNDRTELAFYGGAQGREQFTTVYPSSVKTVHRLTRTRGVAAARSKMKGK